MAGPSNISKPVKYFENWLLKKEGVNTWIKYWGVIRGKWLQFYERENVNDKPELRKTLELTTVTQCALVKRRKKRFPFSINNGVGIYYLKCETEIDRYHWIFSILTTALGNPKKELPKLIPRSMLEKTAFPKTDKNGKTKTNMSPEKPPARAKTPDEFNNRRRQKYAIRNENRTRRKEAKRVKKLGLEPKSDLSSTETSPVKDIANKKRDKLRRTQKLYFETEENLQKYKSMEVLKDFPSPEPASTTKKKKVNIIEVMVYPSSKEPENGVNYAFEHDEFTIPVVLSVDEQVLPNMVISNISDDESDLSTAETSVNSEVASFLSLSCNDISNNRLSDRTTSHTYLSKSSEMPYEQRPTDGRLISSPNMAKNRRVLNIANSHERPNSAGGRLQVHRSVLDRPISPLPERPITPPRTTASDFSRFLIK